MAWVLNFMVHELVVTLFTYVYSVISCSAVTSVSVRIAPYFVLQC